MVLKAVQLAAWKICRYLEYYEIGEPVEVTIMRADSGDYKEQTLTIVLGEAVKTEPTGRR